jgi:hypothetical protein
VRRELEAAQAKEDRNAEIAVCFPAGFCHYNEDPYVQIQDVR